MSEIVSLFAADSSDALSLGGKGASLCQLARAGFPVPPGFVVTTDAYQRLGGRNLRSDKTLVDAILAAYQAIPGPVAIRSSATGEDGDKSSFAGQQETFLGIEGDDALLDAIERCWSSLHTERAMAYRRQHGIPDDSVAMAVVVQQLIPADVAGVCFTRDPIDPKSNRMIIESSYGLGETVVSGKVTPDRFVLDPDRGHGWEKHLGQKTVRQINGRVEPVPIELQKSLSLNDNLLVQLERLARQVETFHGGPRDIEWAIWNDAIYLLQSRPITNALHDLESIRKEIIAELRQKADPRGTVWVRYNLSEILPRPTPMTWAVVQRLIAADGGIGWMNRDLGGRPDPSLGSQSAFDLIAGRPMANLSRMPRLQFRHPPIEYPFAKFKENPQLALNPQAVVNPLRDGWLSGLVRLPGTIWRLWRMGSMTRDQSQVFAERFRTQIVPSFVADARATWQQDFAQLDSQSLLDLFSKWTQRTLVDFARESLKPTYFSEVSWAALVEILKPKLGEDQARVAVGEIALGARPDRDADLATAFAELAASRMDRSEFLERFGHRAADEMELSSPRWSEIARRIPKPTGVVLANSPNPDLIAERIIQQAKLDRATQTIFRKQCDQLRSYLGLRETAKHYLMLGYAILRRVLVELDRRHHLRGGIFFLVPAELPQLIAGANFSNVIAARRSRRSAELLLEVPAVVFSDDLEAIGRPAPLRKGATELTGVSLSPGVAEGPAFVLDSPIEHNEPLDGYVLVCPSTDPAWVPLFARARALVMETGGVLSHGAIVAREFGIPAIAGLPGIMNQIRTGQTIRVDGMKGTAAILSE